MLFRSNKLEQKLAEDPENVADLRAFTQNTADIVVEATDPAEKTPYEPYYNFDEPLRRIPNHRVLAIDRGEREGKLRVRVNVNGAAATARLGNRWPRRQGVFAPVFDAAIADVKAGKTGPVPRELQNVHADGTGFEREQGYKYPHSFPNHWVRQQYLPDALKGAHYYEYGDNKLEQTAKKYWDEIKKRGTGHANGYTRR